MPFPPHPLFKRSVLGKKILETLRSVPKFYRRKHESQDGSRKPAHLVANERRKTGEESRNSTFIFHV
jgi:hypothetical protein